MSISLFNPNDFGVYVHAIERQLAPYETVAIEDAQGVEQLLASGVLTDAKGLEDKVKADADDLSKTAEGDAQSLEQQVRDRISALVKTWHAEHQNPDPADLDDPAKLAANPTGAALKGEKVKIPLVDASTEADKLPGDASELTGPPAVVFDDDHHEEVVQGDTELAQIGDQAPGTDGDLGVTA